MSVVAIYLQVHRVSVLPCKKSPVTEANEFHTSRHVTKAKHRSATLLRLVYCITAVGASPCVLQLSLILSIIYLFSVAMPWFNFLIYSMRVSFTACLGFIGSQVMSAYIKVR